ncbi:DEAD/DEAH box helicase [Chryseosolibacter indicus]|uniref:DEAD/DEAH box helicase n=1 Tax=Chryseosolibacter indicus TaxID=2782351 RepID=A0ABS5VTI9_9BACT|nr:DEAD/DEAH box helicase [Chryseosolibacter indicus]MBT1704739.1 DEAD/DEAH box helicase [Chryseosolibacter indicus]
MSFKHFDLSDAVLKAVEEKGYNNPTPIQQQSIPQILAGVDVLASAQTGTGKTAAFCIPILQKLSLSKDNRHVRALILVPTRELAIQVCDNLKDYGKYLSLKSTVIFGGVSQFNQERELRKGVDIVVATPGRLLDLLDQNIINLKHLEILVLDEADRMLDMGFIHNIKKLIKVIPATRQNVFFSATVPEEVQDLVSTMLKKPVRISINNVALKPKIRQSVYYVQRESKRELLKHVISEHEMQNVIVFARTKYGADKIAKDLNKSGISAEAFHGDKSQNARQKALSNFKRNATRVLVATDIAARGIDIADLPFVINYELPESADTYTHRIGRTGRAGQTGVALSFCDQEERGQLKNINRISTANLTVVEHPFN